MSDTEIALPGATALCHNCNAELHGPYCYNCGQKHRTPHDYRLLHFLRHAIQEFTDLDSKILRSPYYLLFRPGKLTQEWRSGKENSYVKPLRLFLVVNVFYFLFLQFVPVDSIVVSLHSQYNWQMYSSLVRPVVDAHVHAAHVTFEKFAESYDALTATEAKTLIIFMVPVFAALLALLYIRKRHYFVEHLVFSLHFYAFFLLLISIGSYVVEVAANLAVIAYFHVFGLNIQANTIDWDSLITTTYGVPILLYLGIALQRVYKGKIWANAVRAAVLTYSVLYILWFYRFILFFTTIEFMPKKF